MEAVEVVPAMVQQSRLTQFGLLLLRWAVEILAVLFLVVLVVRLVHATGWPTWAVLLALFAPWAALVAWPASRHWALAPVMCRVVRHRLRAWMLNSGNRNRSGRLPWTLLVLPSRVGVRVWLWMVPGLSVRDFHENATEEIAAACFARSARVERSRSLAALIRVDLVTRDPLLGVLVRSDLAPDESGRTGKAGSESGRESGPLRLLTVVPDDLANRPTAGNSSDGDGGGSGEGLPATGTDGAASATPSASSGASSWAGGSSSRSGNAGRSSSASSSSAGGPVGPVSRFGGEDGADYV